MWILMRGQRRAAPGFDRVNQQPPEPASLVRRVDRQYAEVPVIAVARPVDAAQRTALRFFEQEELPAPGEIADLLDSRAIAGFEEALDGERRVDQPHQLRHVVRASGAHKRRRQACRDSTIEGVRRADHRRASWYTHVLSVAPPASSWRGSPPKRTAHVGR